MQVLTPSTLGGILQGYTVISHQLTATQVAEASSPSAPLSDKLQLSQLNSAKQEVEDWMQAIAKFKSRPENHSPVPGVVSVENLSIPASAIPHYSGLSHSTDLTLTVSGTLDSSEKTLLKHHNEPQFHLLAYGPKRVEMEYWREEAMEGGHFGFGSEYVGSVYRTEAANHDTIVNETVDHLDGSLVGSFTRPLFG